LVVKLLRTVVCIGVLGCSSPVLRPKTPLVPTPNGAFRQLPPAPQRSIESKLPPLETRRLDNGLTVFLVARDGPTLVGLSYVIRSGGTHRSLEKTRLTELVTALLLQSDELEKLAPSWETSPESIRVGLTIPSAQLENALSTLAAAVHGRRFRDTEVRRLRQRWLDDLILTEDSPATAIRDVLTRHYSPTSTLGAPADIQARALSQLSPELAFNSWTEIFAPEESALILVGDLDPDTTFDLVDAAFGDLSSERLAKARPQAPQRPSPTAVRIIDTRAPTTICAAIFPAPPQHSPDYLAFSLARLALVEMHSSRLYRALRQERPLAYGIGSSYQASRSEGSLTIQVTLGREQVGPALDAVTKEVTRLGSETMKDEELSVAKTQLLERQRNRRERDLLGEIADMFAEGAPSPWIDQRPLIEAVRAEGVRRVAARYLDPNRMPVAVAGDGAFIGAQLQWSRFKLEHR
jgi:zinc protease